MKHKLSLLRIDGELTLTGWHDTKTYSIPRGLALEEIRRAQLLGKNVEFEVYESEKEFPVIIENIDSIRVTWFDSIEEAIRMITWFDKTIEPCDADEREEYLTYGNDNTFIIIIKGKGSFIIPTG